MSDHRPRMPDNRRIYCVGDIHGRFDLLTELVSMIKRDALDFGGSKVIVYLGDYIDRGPESKQVLDFLVAGPPEGFDQVCLLGNHEKAMLDFLMVPEQCAAWLGFGGRETLESYGVSEDDVESRWVLTELRNLLKSKLPESHREFLRDCSLTHSEGDYFFAHAGVKPGCPLDLQDPKDLMWIRDEFTQSDQDHGAVVVHGHSIMEKPVFRSNRIGIDTGAFYTGVLTALILEGEDQRLLQTGVSSSAINGAA